MSPSHQIHPLIRFAVERRVTMGMAILAVLVLGVLALSRLPLEFLPAISSSNISVTVSYRSASPDEIERVIVRPLEDSFGTLNRLDQLSAQATADSARLDLTFLDGTNMDLATVEVRDRIDRVRHLLPSEVDRIRIRRFQSSDIPVLRFHVSAGWPSDQLYDYTERVLQRRLERLEGVAQVDIRGLRTREVQVRLDPARLAALGVDVRTLAASLRGGHLNLSAGHVVEDGRKLLVRTVGELGSLEEIRALHISDTGLTLGDVADVVYAFPRQQNFSFLNGVEALTVGIYKSSGANLLTVVERARAELDALQQEPSAEGLAIRVFHDSSRDVRLGLGQLRDAGLIGGGLAIIAVFLFLRRLRTTLLIGIAIPVSVVFTFVIMFLMRRAGWQDLTLNVVSLMGLVLALGMLVDSAIVVIESIFRRFQEYGDRESPATSAMRGASEVAMPILASTATTLCVFIPIIFLRSQGGFFARYFIDIGTTVCIVLVASLLVALTVVPMAAALLLKGEKAGGSPFFDWLAGLYGRGLRVVLRHRLLFLVLAVDLLLGSWAMFNSIERAFSSRNQARELTIQVDTPRGYSLAQTQELFEEVAGTLMRKKEELDIADVSYSYFVGSGRSRSRFRRRQLELYLKDESESRLTTAQVRDRIAELLPVKAGVTLKVATSQRGPSRSGMTLELSGDDGQVLELLAQELSDRILQMPGIRDVDLSLESGNDEVLVAVERELAQEAGLSSQTVALTVQSALTSRPISYLKTEDREIDLVMQYRDEDRASIGQLRNVPVRGAGSDLPLDVVADLTVVPGPRSIDRENRQSKITLTAETAGSRASFGALFALRGLMESTPMPPGYSWRFGRWTRLDQQDQEGSDFTLLFALILVYLLMAALFESFLHPFSIMLSVPFAFVGVGLVMKLAGQARDSFLTLGFIILVGVVVNNAIVLIDHINRLRREGLGRQEAIVTGGRHRLRAILMTAVTTILGLLPMVSPILFPQWFGPLEGRAATWAPVGLVILGGLTTSTFLTLVVTPMIYSLLDDAARFVRHVARSA